MHKVKPKIPVFYVKDALNFLENSWTIQKYAPSAPSSPKDSQGWCDVLLGSMNLSHKKVSFNISFPLSNLGLLNAEEMPVMCREMAAIIKFLSCHNQC